MLLTQWHFNQLSFICQLNKKPRLLGALSLNYFEIIFLKYQDILYAQEEYLYLRHALDLEYNNQQGKQPHTEVHHGNQHIRYIYREL